MVPTRQDKQWPEKLAFELALGYYPPEDLAPMFDLSMAQLQSVQSDPAFDKLVKHHRREIEKGGDAFKLKARKFADILLDELFTIATDPLTSPTERRQCIEAVCRYAGFDKQQQAEGGGQQFQVNIQLNA